MQTSPTHRKSFIPVDPDSHYPLNNLPWGIFRTSTTSWRVGMALGTFVIDLDALAQNGLMSTPWGKDFFKVTELNPIAEKGPQICREIRMRVQELFSEDRSELRDQRELLHKVVVPQADVQMALPFRTSGYTDFYSSINHATNVGKLFRDKDQPLLPNWKHLPVAYNGRASTLIPSGTPLHRPFGQVSPGAGQSPQFKASAKLDYELELGYYIGTENPWQEPIGVETADRSIFGFVIVNDWSARDIQAWEYVPLGPFLGKSFATSVSSWVVTPEALAPFRVKMESQDPMPLSYLSESERHCFDVVLEVWLSGKGISKPEKIAQTNARELYWSFNQQIAHHTVNGCQLKIGDLLATGTISGKTNSSLGCLLEATLNGTSPLVLSTGAERRFLEDHDVVTMVAYAQGPGYRVGFGEVRGEILPAKELFLKK
jgi:fumarylacetoacetase